ncbi:MAG TPA: hypothetical protein EYQ34_05510 [Acidimicrobiia bacterium]|jgi:hypothetical protein|nr:hypothetical protein [Acidimicrobiia bacterium]
MSSPRPSPTVHYTFGLIMWSFECAINWGGDSKLWWVDSQRRSQLGISVNQPATIGYWDTETVRTTREHASLAVVGLR